VATNVSSAAIDGAYYPSCKIRLILRFEEYGSNAVQASSPPKPVPLLRGFKDQAAPLVARVDNSLPGARRFTLEQAGAKPAPGGPQGQSSSSDDKTHVIAGIIPKRLTWSQNGLRAGDTVHAKIKFVDCPIDPRTVRSCAVEVYLGTVSADDYARGVAGQTRTGSTGQVNYAEPLNVIPDAYQDAQGVQRTNLRFQGWVDEWADEWDEEGEPLLSIECCDNTRLLINVQAPAGLAISPKKPLDQAIADYLSNFPNFAGLTVETRPAGTTPPALQTALAGTVYQPQLGPTPARGTGAVEKLSVLDYLVDVCGAVAYSLNMDGTTLVLQQPLTLLDGKGGARPDDPFQGRTVDGETFQYRRLVWGRNLGKLKVARKFAKKVATAVMVRCYSTRRKKDLVAFFPDPKSQAALLAASALPGDGSTQQNWVEWRVQGVEDQATLLAIAQNVYQSVGRQEIELDLRTVNLASFGAGNFDPDLLDMKTGDTFELLTARATADVAGAVGLAGSGTIAEIEQALMADAAAEMRGLGFDDGLASAYATAYVNAGFQTLYRLRQMSIDWDADEQGVSIDLRGVNYVEVRADKPFGAT
jgi:hypothetical protein